MRPNRLRELLDADEPSLGTHIMSTWPSVIELAGNSGNCAFHVRCNPVARALSFQTLATV